VGEHMISVQIHKKRISNKRGHTFTYNERNRM